MQFEWSFPVKVFFGAGKFQNTHKYLRGFGKRAFIVTSPSFQSGPRKNLLDDLLKQLHSINVETEVFSKIEPNPRTTTIDQAAALLRKFRPRYVIAFGGGSVMDAAKCLSVLGENEGFIYEFAYKGTGQPMRPFQKTLPLVCIPTVAATSSETDSYAVVTNWEINRKVTVFGEALLPAMAIIDPELTYTISPQQSIDGAFDMITHVIETYLSCPEARLIQDNLTEAIVETVVKALPVVLKNPNDELGRSNLSWCGALALSGVLSGRNGGWPIHALEHGLSAYTDVAHGRGLSMLLPRVMLFDSEKVSDKLIHFNKKIFGTKSSSVVQSLETGFFSYMKDVGAWTCLKQTLLPGQSEQQIITKSIEHAFETSAVFKREQQPYLDNIRPVYQKDAQSIFEACI